METVAFTIDNIRVEASKGQTILEAADKADIYIPRLCYHPDLPSFTEAKSSPAVYRGKERLEGTEGHAFEGCGLCAVQVEGRGDFPLACNTPASPGMVVHTNTPQVQELRQERLMPILAKHPHACLTCAEREGCAREPCRLKVEVNARCCPKLGRCEFQKVAEYIGVKAETPRYTFKDLPIIKDEPLFDRDYNLCIGCTRCVRACQNLRQINALGFTWQNGEVRVGTLGPSLREAACKFCGACAEVCPTGAIIDRPPSWTDREKVLVPCRAACPAGVDVPSYLHLIAEGKSAQAAAVVREKLPLPTVLGRVCAHPCEEECRRGKVNEPMAICALKRSAMAEDSGMWRQRAANAPATGKKVAIIGSGPAGLTAAYYLARRGHQAIIFEALPQLGGMMRVGIPEYRLPREVLDQDIAEILKAGVEARINTPVKSLQELRQQGFHAIFIAAGAHKGRPLRVEGENKDGVLQGVSLLKDLAQGKIARNFLQGKRVAVIGGGNVAIDAARSSVRLGAKQVQLICLESREEMPAHEWEIQAAAEEGVAINCCWGPRLIQGNGQVGGVEFKGCTAVFDAEGRFNPTYDETRKLALEADTVILAIGQAPDLSFLDGEDGIGRTGGGFLRTDGTMKVAGGVFAGGDVLGGAATVVRAVAEGRKAAAAIDKFLGGKGDIDEVLVAREKPSPVLGREEGYAERNRQPMPCLAVPERLRGFAEVELGLEPPQALKEAQRCLRCDLRLTISAVRLPPEKWLRFEAKTIDGLPEAEGVFQLLNEGKEIIYIAGTANLRQTLQEQLGTKDKACYFTYEEHPMYTMRESELLQKFLQEHGSLPEGNQEDLF